MPENAPHSPLDRLRNLPRWVQVTSGLTVVALAAAGVLYATHTSATHENPQSTQTSQEVTAPMELLQADHINLPGAHLETGGLHVEPVPFAIVNQDGSGGQPNPPVNLYGAHLRAKGDFNVEAKLKDVAGTAKLSLYGDVPVIYDEFRDERNSLEVSISGTTLTVQRWSNGSQQPQTNTYDLATAASDRKLTVTKQNDRLHLAVDGQQVADLPEANIFRSGNVWFGASAEQQPWVLSSLVATKENAEPLEVVVTTSPNINTVDQQGLQYLVNQKNKRPGFTIGAAVSLAPLVSDSQYAGIVLGGNFGSITTENALKWQAVHPAPNTYSFTEGDALVALAQRYNLKIHGHTLVFGEANPRWVQGLPTATNADKANVEQVMTDHIRTVVGHYAGKIASWDVVNEALADYDQFEQGQMLRDTKWSQAMGEAFIAKAFHAARAADPDAKLFINEFGLEEDGERWDYFLQLVTRLKEQGVPIDGVGFQTHIYERSDRTNAKVLQRHIEELAKIGLVSRISENDVYSEDGQKVQAKEYATNFRVCYSSPSCVSYTTWGVSDRYDKFRDDDGSIQDGQDFLWDRNMQPTPAVAAVRSVITSQ